MFGEIGIEKILLILLVVLLFFGAKRIPELAGSMGKGIREFKRSLSDPDRAARDPGVAPGQSDAPLDHAPLNTATPVARDESEQEPKRLLR
jgi:sec-independent protein translocase protein TatA